MLKKIIQSSGLRTFLIFIFAPGISSVILFLFYGWNGEITSTTILFFVILPLSISYWLLMITSMSLYYVVTRSIIEDGVFECRKICPEAIIIKASQYWKLENSFSHIVDVIFADESPLYRKFMKWLWDFNGLDKYRIRRLSPDSLPEKNKNELKIGDCLRIKNGKVIELLPATA